MIDPLETPRLSLRAFTVGDAEAWHGIWGDPGVIWWGPSPSLEKSTASLERLVAAMAGWPPGQGWLAVSERGRPEIVGDVMIQRAPFVDGVEIGWHFRRHVWGRGYATEAARALLERTLAEGFAVEVFALVALRNRPSLRVVEKLAMQTVRDQEHAGMPHRLFVRRRGA